MIAQTSGWPAAFQQKKRSQMFARWPREMFTLRLSFIPSFTTQIPSTLEEKALWPGGFIFNKPGRLDESTSSERLRRANSCGAVWCGLHLRGRDNCLNRSDAPEAARPAAKSNLLKLTPRPNKVKTWIDISAWLWQTARVSRDGFPPKKKKCLLLTGRL